MFNSPSSGVEFREAIVSSLSPGEQLVSFADCVEPFWWVPADGSAPSPQYVIWYFLALTNINVRQGMWNWNHHENKEGFFKPKEITMTPIPSIREMTVIGIDDIVKTTHSKGPFDQRIALHMSTFLTKEVAPIGWASGGGVYLQLTLTNGDIIDVGSPFIEMERLITDIDAAKSGALVVKNTTAAADALDQLVPLLNDGILTQEEFDRAKDGFLGATVEVRESSAGLLRQVHSLYKSGVLSESEFNLKKWDILSKSE